MDYYGNFSMMTSLFSPWSEMAFESGSFYLANRKQIPKTTEISNEFIKVQCIIP